MCCQHHTIASMCEANDLYLHCSTLARHVKLIIGTVKKLDLCLLACSCKDQKFDNITWWKGSKLAWRWWCRPLGWGNRDEAHDEFLISLCNLCNLCSVISCKLRLYLDNAHQHLKHAVYRMLVQCFSEKLARRMRYMIRWSSLKMHNVGQECVSEQQLTRQRQHHFQWWHMTPRD